MVIISHNKSFELIHCCQINQFSLTKSNVSLCLIPYMVMEGTAEGLLSTLL